MVEEDPKTSAEGSAPAVREMKFKEICYIWKRNLYKILCICTHSWLKVERFILSFVNKKQVTLSKKFTARTRLRSDHPVLSVHSRKEKIWNTDRLIRISSASSPSSVLARWMTAHSKLQFLFLRPIRGKMELQSEMDWKEIIHRRSQRREWAETKWRKEKRKIDGRKAA